jgi:hypothetical protein
MQHLYHDDDVKGTFGHCSAHVAFHYFYAIGHA